MSKTRSPRVVLSDPAIEMLAARFKVLSEPSRLRLIIALEQGEKNVSELMIAARTTQANVSRQLQVLARAGIIARRKEGVVVYYRIVDPAIFTLCQQVCGSLQKQLVRQAESAKLFPG